MNKAEAKKRIRLQVLRTIENDWKFVVSFAKRGDDEWDNDEVDKQLRAALSEEIQHLAKRAYGFVDDSYGRNRCVVERVYETRIDCKSVPGEARIHTFKLLSHERSSESA